LDSGLCIGDTDAAHAHPETEQFLRYVGYRQYRIDQSGGNGSQRHPVEFGIGRALHQGDATLLLDTRQAHCTITACTGKHYTETSLLVHIGQITEEQIDGDMLSQRPRRGTDLEVAVSHDQLPGR